MDGDGQLDTRSPAGTGLAALMHELGGVPGGTLSPEQRERLGAVLTGYREDPAAFLARTFSETDGYDEMIVLNGLRFSSHDAETQQPLLGRASVGYIPRHRVVGVSKLYRVVDILARRLQTPERLAGEIADTIQDVLAPHGVAVVLTVRHPALDHGGHVVTRRMHGLVAHDPATRRQFDCMVGTPAP